MSCRVLRRYYSSHRTKFSLHTKLEPLNFYHVFSARGLFHQGCRHFSSEPKFVTNQTALYSLEQMEEKRDPFILERLNIFHRLKEKEKGTRMMTSGKVGRAFVVLPDDKLETIKLDEEVSCPSDVLGKLRLKFQPVAALVNEVPWDMSRPVPDGSRIKFLEFSHPLGSNVFWHSSAHMLGYVLELFCAARLCSGPATKNGFYYEFSGGTEKNLVSSDLLQLEVLLRDLAARNDSFERLEVARDDALRLMKDNPFKTQVIRNATQPTFSFYRFGHFVDLCRGPHIPRTGLVKAVALTQANLLAPDEGEEPRQRVRGVSFLSKQLLENWHKKEELQRLRSHQHLGEFQNLFMFSKHSPGSPFFLPYGTHIYNKLCDYLRQLYRDFGYREVMTPTMFNSDLWRRSGHWEHFKENMFLLEGRHDSFALKPMNCPSHCLIYRDCDRSYRELPIRLADFGALHRNELTCSGLTRLLRFVQDDAHIFCGRHQIAEEMSNCLQFMKLVYESLGFSYHVQLSTRPQKFLGKTEDWRHAEEKLQESLEKEGLTWSVNQGDGAFYGPKIDVDILDALGRAHQCATFQLDFQLPLQFNLQYRTQEETWEPPVIIHRAVLGSLERMFAILLESYGGKWPFWLSPRQVAVVPVASSADEYAREIASRLYRLGFEAEARTAQRERFSRKIRECQLLQFNFILVVGDAERKHWTVNVRTRDNQVIGEMPLEEFSAKAARLNESRSLSQEIF